jgi:hypothetical protein
MSTNLRISLTILSAGFAVEGAAEVYSLLTAGSFLPGTSLLFLLPALVTLLGLLFLLIGRHEWDDLHRARIRRANLIFGLSLLAGFVAGIEVAVLTVYSVTSPPLWASIVFGMAAGSFLLGTFVTYAQLVFHLVTRPSKVALVASSLWALIVSALIGQTLAADLPSILATIGAHSFSIGYLVSPVDYLASFLFVSYFLLLGAYVDAHVTVARRRARWLGRGSGRSAAVRSGAPPAVPPVTAPAMPASAEPSGTPVAPTDSVSSTEHSIQPSAGNSTV